MAKKIDIKRTLGNPTPSLSVEAIEEMTRKIHQKNQATTVVQPTAETITIPPAATQTAQEITQVSPKKELAKKSVSSVKVESSTPTKRGRKPNPPVTDERMIRVSVDLPESVFIKLKTKVIQERTDMKTFVWKLVENHLK